MKFYNPNVVKVGLIPALFVAGIVGTMAYQTIIAVTTPDCGNSPNVVEGYLQGNFRKPGDSVACPDVANLKNILHPIPAKDPASGCVDVYNEAVARHMATPAYNGTCEQANLLVKQKGDSGLYP